MKNRISFYTLGCRLNQSETAVIENTFSKDGYRIVNFNEPADYVVINTCTVTENGDADTRRLVNKVNRINPQARIALVGCQAQIQKEKLTELPNVRWVVGNAKKFELTSIIKELDAAAGPHTVTPAIPRTNFKLPVAAVDRRHTRANLKIQDGCDFFCSFCEIPYARGRARSREFNDILTDARALVAAGHKEVVVTGINVGTYRHGKKTFLNVIDALEGIGGLERIRISSIEPTTIPLKLFDKMKPGAKLCRHLHIPVQSGSTQILNQMKRKYTTEEFSDFLMTVYNKVPGLCIGTDVIVGFPAETEENFAQTKNLLRELPFAYFHIFSYSERNIAQSRKLSLKIDPRTIQSRSKILRELSIRKRRVFHESLIGTTQKILFEQKKNNFWNGLTDNYVKISVKSERKLNNRLVSAQLCRMTEHGIEGKLI